MTEVAVLHWAQPSPADERARALAEFSGLEVRAVDLRLAASIPGIRAILASHECLLVSADCLVQMRTVCADNGKESLAALTDSERSVFVYGFRPTKDHCSLVRALSSEVLTDIKKVDQERSEFQIKRDRELCHELSGLSFSVAQRSGELYCFEGREAIVQDPIITLNHEPFFVSHNGRSARLFFLTDCEFADLDREMKRDDHLNIGFWQFVPLLMFLKNLFQDRVWHNEHPQACFVVDDPLLQERYGFLHFQQLFNAMRPHKFALSIAFIPWNYGRSTKAITSEFANDDYRASICVHGCDHTAAEFATHNVSQLREKSTLALERMQLHQRKYGVPFDRVMVFPQGLFSKEAMTALRDAGYIAAVNSDPHPQAEDASVSLRSLLDAAVMSFSGFPLFTRRYPKDIVQFALDLFVGKPAIVVEHHKYFKTGYAHLQAFVKDLNALNPSLEWANLGTICSRTCLKKTGKDGDIYVRFYGTTFEISNEQNRTVSYVLQRFHPAGTPLPTLTINGNAVACSQEGDYLIAGMRLEARQIAQIHVSDRTGSMPTVGHEDGAKAARVRLRRLLCEFRDNHVDTNPLFSEMLSYARKVRARATSSINN